MTHRLVSGAVLFSCFRLRSLGFALLDQNDTNLGLRDASFWAFCL